MFYPVKVFALNSGVAPGATLAGPTCTQHLGNTGLQVCRIKVCRFGWLAGWLVGWLDGWLVWFGLVWLVGWLVGWLAGWLVGWLVGWLAG